MNGLIFALGLDFKNQWREEERQWLWFKHTTRNVGAYKVANILDEHGIETEVIDFLQYWKREELKKFLEDRKHLDYKFIGFSSTFPSWSTVRYYVELAKEYFPDAIYITGGQQDFVEDIGCDYYVSGFAEKAVPAIIEHELNGGELNYEPLYGGKVVKTLHGEYQTHMIGDYPIKYKDNDFLTPHDTLALEVGRGCKFKCDFCSFSLIGLRDRVIRTSDSLRKEIVENYERWGITNYVLADDTFNETNERIQVLADAIEGLDFEPTFSSFVRLDIVAAHPEQIDLLIKARVMAHYYGIETFGVQAGKSIAKGMKPERVKENLLYIYDRMTEGLGEFHGDIGMIIGLPFESVAEIEDSYNWLYENWRGPGQNVIWWPFQITKDGILESKISMNPEKYGYWEMDLEDKEEFEKMMCVKPNLNSWPWQNEHMNAIEAFERFERYMGPWYRNNRCTGYGEAVNARARLGSMLARWQNDEQYEKEFMRITCDMLDEYKRKKLEMFNDKKD